MSGKKEIAELRRKAQQQGFTISRTGKSHLRWVAPNGAFTITSSTPSDGRQVIQNITRDLKSIGFDPHYTKPKKEITQMVPVKPQQRPSEIESSVCTQDGCGRRFSNNMMPKHLLEVHKIHSCTQCERTFGAPHNLARHMTAIHKINLDGSPVTVISRGNPAPTPTKPKVEPAPNPVVTVTERKKPEINSEVDFSPLLSAMIPFVKDITPEI